MGTYFMQMLLWLLELDDGLLRNMVLSENGEGLRFYQVAVDTEADAVAKAICDSYVARLLKPEETEADFAKRVGRLTSVHSPAFDVALHGAGTTTEGLPSKSTAAAQCRRYPL
jgi:hypothetical protein